MTETAPIIEFVAAEKLFADAKKPVHAVAGVDLAITKGEIFGVIGYSGAGKSTLVRMINGLEQATAGQVRVFGQVVNELSESKLRKLRLRIGMIFQQFNLFSSRTVAGNVGYPLAVAKMPRAERKKRVAELLEFVGLADKARSYPSQLSGGQKQRVGIARALATNPEILLADESTSALDPETTADVLSLLKKINNELGLTIVVITHEMDVVKHICDRVAVMEHGKVVELGEVYSVFADPQHPASQKFVGTSVKDKPDEATLARLRDRHPGRLVLVTVHEDGSSGSRITDVLAENGVTGTIIYGGISEVKERPFGSLTWELFGPQEGIEAALSVLASYTKVIDFGTKEAPLVGKVI